MLILDCEVYSDYFLLAVIRSGGERVRRYEMYPGHPLDDGIAQLLTRHSSAGFNSLNYDLPIIAAAVRGATNRRLKELSDKIIIDATPWWKLGIRVPNTWDHIDLFHLAVGQGSLKIYGGRLHAPKLQDLPIDPAASINAADREKLRTYCANDLALTDRLYQRLTPQIELREKMTKQYGVDLRSKSDAQIAEAVIRHEIERLGGQVSKPYIKPETTFRYLDPDVFEFQSVKLQNLLARLLAEDFPLSSTGSIDAPVWLKKSTVTLGGVDYHLGMGGLHSSEKRQFVEPSKHEFLIDLDVTSYYPAIILGQRLSPKHLGEPFLAVFQTLVDRRIAAKRRGDMVEADALKITINGTFGKLGSKYSFLHSPDLLLQTTLTGQLAMLMLIEQMNLRGIRTVSANTDGIVLHANLSRLRDMEEVAWDWMLSTGYELEQIPYRLIASRDVNNYFAIKPDGQVKGKGIFAPPSLAKNPDAQIVYDVVIDRVARGTSIEQAILECRDITRFVCVRHVTGGAVWGDQWVGKAIRYYHSSTVCKEKTITYLKNGNKVPNTQGARPLMKLPTEFPDDVDYAVYFAEAEKLLREVGYR